MIKEQEKIIASLVLKDKNKNVTLFTKNGLTKQVPLKDFEVTRYSKPMTAIKLKENDELSITIKLNEIIIEKLNEFDDKYDFKNSLERIKPHVYRYWYERRYNQDISDKHGLLYEKGQYTKILTEINCKEKTEKTISITTYNQDGNVVETTTKKADEITPSYIIPNTYGDEDRKQICKIGEAKYKDKKADI